MDNIRKKEEFQDYVLVFIIIAMSGFPFFSMEPLFKPALFISFIFSLILFHKRDKIWSKFIINYIYVFLIIIIGQAITFSYIPTFTTLGYIIRILLAFFVVQITGKNFVKYYVNILYVFTIISFFFYFPTIINNNFERFFVSHVTPFFDLPQDPNAFYKSSHNVIIFNFNSELDYLWGAGFIRNSGPFWEPGAFAGFLIIALLFNLVKVKKLYEKQNTVMILGIITTFSTSGYIALFLVFLFYYLFNSQSQYRFLIIPVIIALASYSYFKMEFLDTKIKTNISTIGTSNTSNRFVSGLTDLKDIKSYWLFGRGFNVETRYDQSTLRLGETHRNNGITALAINIGIWGFLLYFYFIYRAYKNYCGYEGFYQLFAFAALFIILTIGLSEGYFTKVFFISLTMLYKSFEEVKHF